MTHAIPAQRPPLVQPQAPVVQHPPVAQHNAAPGQKPKGFYVWFTILAVLEGILILCTFAAPQLAIVSLPAAWLIWHLWRSYGRRGTR